MQVRAITITAVIITIIMSITIVVAIIMIIIIIITDNTVLIYTTIITTGISFITSTRIPRRYCTSTGWRSRISLLTAIVPQP
jgi:hypothetical protein